MGASRAVQNPAAPTSMRVRRRRRPLRRVRVENLTRASLACPVRGSDTAPDCCLLPPSSLADKHEPRVRIVKDKKGHAQQREHPPPIEMKRDEKRFAAEKEEVQRWTAKRRTALLSNGRAAA